LISTFSHKILYNDKILRMIWHNHRFCP